MELLVYLGTAVLAVLQYHEITSNVIPADHSIQASYIFLQYIFPNIFLLYFFIQLKDFSYTGLQLFLNSIFRAFLLKKVSYFSFLIVQLMPR